MSDTPNAVITGGASGMGLEMARLIVKRGGRVMIADMDEAALRKAGREFGTAAMTFKTDVSKRGFVDAMADRAFRELGTVGLVFANAGLQFNSPVLTASEKEFDLQFGANIKGSWMTAQAFARHWTRRGMSGRICFTGSEHSLGFQHAGAGLYTATKHAVLGMADVLRREVPDSIGISIFCPGLVDTEFYASRQKAGLGASDEELKMGKRLMSQGMPAEEAAKAAVDGTLADEFFIFTHAVARDGAKARWEEVDEAFEKQAPAGSDAKNYKVTDLAKQLSSKS